MHAAAPFAATNHFMQPARAATPGFAHFPHPVAAGVPHGIRNRGFTSGPSNIRRQLTHKVCSSGGRQLGRAPSRQPLVLCTARWLFVWLCALHRWGVEAQYEEQALLPAADSSSSSVSGGRGSGASSGGGGELQSRSLPAPQSPPTIDMESFFASQFFSFQNTIDSKFPPHSEHSTGVLVFDRSAAMFAYHNRTVTRDGATMPPPIGGVSEYISCISQSEQFVNVRDRSCSNRSIPPKAQGRQLTRTQCENYAAGLFSPLAFGNLSSPFCLVSGHACALYRNATFKAKVTFDGRAAEQWTTRIVEQLSPEQRTTALYEFIVDRGAKLLLSWVTNATDVVTPNGGERRELNSSIGVVFRGITAPAPASAAALPPGIKCSQPAER
jgi:hypothetical protein|eukprot:COSAG01_NODE_255_length_20171_cov_8.232164_3_plen_383_part_00